MAKRPVFHPDIANFFKDLREERTKWGQRQAARIAHEKGLSLITANSLGALERGAVKNPDVELLREIARLYRVPFLELLGEFLALRYKVGISLRDLPDHGAGVQREGTPAPFSTPGGTLHDPATSRALRDITAAYETFFRAVQDVSAHLTRALSDAEGATEFRTADSGTSRRRRRR